MLQNPSVRAWLGGIEPAWTLLDQDSFHALRRPPSPGDGPIRLASDITIEETHCSVVARNALIVLQAAMEGPGLKMTATGNLSPNVVAEICDRFSWPEFDKSAAFSFQKAVNESKFLPLYFIRHVTEVAKILRRQRAF